MRSNDPLGRFRRWFKEAQRHPAIDLPEAMCLSTIDARGGPSARMVLLKELAPQGFLFYTNLHSPKSRHLLARPQAALTFHWRPLRRQVRVEGTAVPVPKRTADAYFSTRPRESQIGAWASMQSEPLARRRVLLERFETFKKKFAGKIVPAPSHWVGFCVKPRRIEFWQEGAFRLHDRWRYEKKSQGSWVQHRLYP